MQLIELPGEGPEDVVCDANGLLYTGLYDGRILRIEPGRSVIEVIGPSGS